MINSIDDSQTLLDIMGEPHKLNQYEKHEEWRYTYTEFDFLSLKKCTYFYYFIVDKNDFVIKKTIIEKVDKPFSLIKAASSFDFEVERENFFLYGTEIIETEQCNSR